MTTDWILVGVDGGEGGRAAVRYAAREAARLALGVRLVHVAPELAYTLAVDPETAQTGRHRRAGVLREAAELAREALDADRIATEAVFGSRVDRLVAASRDCRMVVLGDEHRPLVERLVTGSVLAGVAARAKVPVVRVPTVSAEQAEHGRVVVAVKSAEDWDGLLEGALETAYERRARLVLLHAWEMPVLYDDLLAPQLYEHEWEQRAYDALCDLAGRRGPAHRDVPVDLSVVHGQPARAIVEASRDADLVLLARRPLVSPLGHLGGTGRAVLRESACAVEVLPPSSAALGELDGVRAHTAAR